MSKSYLTDYALKPNDIVVVTGASGYVGSHLILQLLEKGYRVKGCVRNVDNERKNGFLKALKEYQSGQLTLHSADMKVEGTYDAIFQGAHTIFHPAEVMLSDEEGLIAYKASDKQDPNGAAKILNETALTTTKYVVDSINRCPSVRRLIYTSSIASMFKASLYDYGDNIVIDENVESSLHLLSVENPSKEIQQMSGVLQYCQTKRTTEHYLAYCAVASGSHWQAIFANPSDIIGPINSKHQNNDNWQGEIGRMLQGKQKIEQRIDNIDGYGFPYLTVDARDVAKAEILLAESKMVQSGERFLLFSGDILYPKHFGPEIMRLFPNEQYDLPSTVRVAKSKGLKQLLPDHPLVYRMHVCNDKIKNRVHLKFRSLDETLTDTVKTLINIGEVIPKRK